MAKQLPAWEMDLAAMAGSVVHEIKNPLSTLNINAQLILEDWKDAEEPRELRTVKRVEVILSEIRRLEGIVNTFIRFAERHQLRPERFLVNETLSELADLVTPEAERRGIRIRQSLSANLPQVAADRGLIKQAFLNLILNAQEAMGEGGDLILKSRLEATGGRQEVVVDIIDTGCGISEGSLPRIFDLYYSSKPGGSGLGLATSRRIIQEHEGRIDVTSAQGKGSQFTVRLPLAPGTGPAAGAAPSAAGSPGNGSGSGNDEHGDG